MSRLTFYLPPFSSDYAGVCSTFFDLDALVVLHDASCCSRNYVTFDEPRWLGSKRPTYCSGLREVDVVCGDDEKLMRKVQHALETCSHPHCVALVGGPVASLTGIDLEGVARELEVRTKVACFGFNTTGMAYYTHGMSDASVKVAKRFVNSVPHKCPRAVNVLGLNALDFGTEDAAALVACVEEAGFEVTCTFPLGACDEAVAHMAQAQASLVVSASGVALAQYLWQRHGVPYVVGACVAGERSALDELERMVSSVHTNAQPREDGEDGEDGTASLQELGNTAWLGGESCEAGESGGVLVVGDQVQANALRRRLRAMGESRCTVASFFGLDKQFAAAHDFCIRDEDALISRIHAGGYSAVVGDPLLRALPGVEELLFVEVPHTAVSSRLYWNSGRWLLSERLSAELAQVVCTLQGRR